MKYYVENGSIKCAVDDILPLGIDELDFNGIKYDDYIENPSAYTIEDNKLIDISDTPEYKAGVIKARKKIFFDEFIKISAGCYRKKPKGYSSAVEAFNTVKTAVDIMGEFDEQLSQLLIFYTQPDFTKEEQCTEEWLIANQIKLSPMTKDEFNKLYIEFQIAWSTQEYLED